MAYFNTLQCYQFGIDLSTDFTFPPITETPGYFANSNVVIATPDPDFPVNEIRFLIPELTEFQSNEIIAQESEVITINIDFTV